eukprot:scaffold70712_cov61-Phaeocystis_antarctica.AAC.6
MEWSQPRVSLEGPAPRGRHTAEAYGTMLLIFGGGAEGKVFDDMWALDIDGSGMQRLEQAATKAGLASGPSEAEQRKGLEGVALSFLLPQMGERPPVAVEPEYDDVEAREADADEVTCNPVHERLQPCAWQGRLRPPSELLAAAPGAGRARLCLRGARDRPGGADAAGGAGPARRGRA